MNITTSKIQKLEINNDSDLIKARQLARSLAVQLGFGIVNQTKIITAVSELIRNVILYAGNGWITFNEIENQGKKGLLIKVDDKGPGIANLELALKGGFSTSGGLGKGLFGTKRLMDEFKIKTEVGSGTEIEIIKWVD